MTTRYCLYSGGIYNEVPYTTLYFAGFLSSSKFNTWRLSGTFYEVRTPPLVLKSTRIYVTSNTMTSSSSCTFYDDGVSTSQAISIPSSTTGAFSVTADVTVADNSMCHFRLVNGSSGSLRIGSFTHVVDMTNDDIQGFTGASHQSTGADTTYYSHAGRSLTESYYQFKTPAGTYDNLGLAVYYQTGGATRTHRFRKNGANGNQIISASGTGWYEDVTNSDTVEEGDLVNLMRTTPNTSEWRIQHLSVQFTPTSNRAWASGTYGVNLNFNSTVYASLGYGSSFPTSTTEASAQNIVKEYAQRIRNLRIVCSTNTIATDPSTCRIRKNGSDGNQIISIPAGTTGTYEDTSNTDNLDIDDLFCFQYVTPNTSGAIVIIPTLIIDDVTVTFQFIHPDGDSSIGSWTNELGSTTNIYLSVDETPASDTDYIQSEENPSSSKCVLTLQDLSDPNQSGYHKLKYRFKKDVSGKALNLIVRLKQGTTVIASSTHTNISTGWTDGSFTLSGAEADSITNYNDLRVEVEATQ